MTFLHTLFLGALSGLTIFFGLPLARFRAVSKEHISFLNAFAVGVLFFLFTDITQHAVAPVESAIQNHAEYVTLLPVLIGGFMVGLLSLIYYTRWFRVKKGELSHAQLALVIAIGIGLHNFSEGLAIGNSASQNVLNLALVLIIGFGLHNITEAFAIAAPLAGQKVSWRFLALCGLIGGLPNTIGTIIGYRYSSDTLSVLFLALAAGAIMYVIGELLAAGRKFESHAWTGWGLAIGFCAGLLTDFILIASGA